MRSQLAAGSRRVSAWPCALGLVLGFGCSGQRAAAGPDLPRLPDSEPGDGQAPASEILAAEPGSASTTDRAAALLRELAARVDRAGTGCDEIEAAVATLARDRARERAAIRERVDDMDEAARQAMDESLRAMLAAELDRISRTTLRCPAAAWDSF